MVGRRVLVGRGRVMSVRAYALYRYRVARRSGLSEGGARDVVAAVCGAYGVPYVAHRNGRAWRCI